MIIDKLLDVITNMPDDIEIKVRAIDDNSTNDYSVVSFSDSITFKSKSLVFQVSKTFKTDVARVKRIYKDFLWQGCPVFIQYNEYDDNRIQINDIIIEKDIIYLICDYWI